MTQKPFQPDESKPNYQPNQTNNLPYQPDSTKPNYQPSRADSFHAPNIPSSKTGRDQQGNPTEA